MELTLSSLTDGSPVGSIEVSDAVFGVDWNETLVHQLIVAYLAGARAGTKAQKNRSQVKGGGSKPWRQKGTGRARSGTSRSPIWRGGGVTFAARPKSFKQKINRKMYRKGLCSIFSELLRQERLWVVDEFKVETHKTKQLAEKLRVLESEQVLIVSDDIDKNLELAARNLHQVSLSKVLAVNPVELVRCETVVLTKGVIDKIESWLAPVSTKTTIATDSETDKE